jgi:hypothetical protein
VNPALRVNRLLGLFRLSEISFEVVVSLVAHFTARHGSTSLRVLIFTCVVHFRNVNKLDIKAAVRTTNMA